MCSMLVLSGGGVGVLGAQENFLSYDQGQQGTGLDAILLRAPIFEKLGWVDSDGSR